MADVRFVLDPDWQRKANLLAEPALEAAAQIVEAGQRRRIPVSRDGSHGRQPGYARDHIHIERGHDVLGPYREIGSDAKTPEGVDYPLILELGSRPHEIVSHGDYPLRDKHGRVFGRRINHPGTHPYPWCRAALADIAGRRF